MPVSIEDGTPEQVVEGSQINLCIVHEGRLDRDVVVILIVQSSTASGKKVCWCLEVVYNKLCIKLCHHNSIFKSVSQVVELLDYNKTFEQYFESIIVTICRT